VRLRGPAAKGLSGQGRFDPGYNWRAPAKCHQVRNIGDYEGDLNLDERIVTDLIATCRAVAAKAQALPPIAER
jgi:hypothetical protein